MSHKTCLIIGAGEGLGQALSLSFLGVGIQPPTADWGSMVRETAELIQFAAYDITAALTPILPAAAIGILTIGVNFVVDWFLYLTSGLKDEIK